MQCKKQGCPFFPSMKGYCSVCYDVTEMKMPESIMSESKEQLPETKQKPENKSKCWKCKKKVGLLGFECSCNHTYCSGCRQAENHSCTFNYFAKYQEQLTKNNPKIIGSKLESMV